MHSTYTLNGKSSDKEITSKRIRKCGKKRVQKRPKTYFSSDLPRKIRESAVKVYSFEQVLKVRNMFPIHVRSSGKK